jgi:hypothetical protein
MPEPADGGQNGRPKVREPGDSRVNACSEKGPIVAFFVTDTWISASGSQFVVAFAQHQKPA